MAKKKYSAPKLSKVKLFTDEVVLTGCKTSPTDSTGKGSKNCAHAGCKTIYAS